ncbi:unnamed protein product [Pedinophyceae sp. YPF-701]|nr:unnamed protein product [Pedinophyceae sp. YPF-701]
MELPPLGPGNRSGSVGGRSRGTPSIASRGSAGGGGGRNPFELPSEDEIFRMRELEKQRRTEARDQNLRASVLDKTTFTSRMATMRVKAKDRGGEGAGGQQEQRHEGVNAMSIAAQTMPVDARKLQKENMAEFVSKKREIFLVQMSLDTKRAEIRKLEERAAQREEALKKSELMLERDAERFDAFLKENDEKVQEALKRAEIEARAKQDKVAEIKKLQSQIAALRSELNKQEELLDDCRRYKGFLHALTPNEWFKEQEEKRQRIIEARMARWRDECEVLEARKVAARQKRVQLEEQVANARSQQEYEQAEKALKEAKRAEIEAETLRPPREPSKELTEEEWSEPMYFTRPRQLLEVFAQLEEQNLFLIQNAQETDEALEGMKQKFAETRERMGRETDALQAQISALKESIAAEEAKSQALRQRAREGAREGMSGATSAAPLEELSNKVREVYIQCGFESDASVGTLQMLTNIETKLEEYLAAIRELPTEFLQEAEKAREKDRRQRAREEKLEQVRQEQAERVKLVLERAYAAPVERRQGKPVMFRSVLPKKKKVVDVVKKDQEEVELEEYLRLPMM